jgi:hypothetical protein
MKKIIYKIAYPFWYLFTKTYFEAITLCVILILPGCLLFLFIPSLRYSNSIEQSESIGVGMAILSLLLSPIFGIIVMKISDKLRNYYSKNGYNINYFG